MTVQKFLKATVLLFITTATMQLTISAQIKELHVGDTVPDIVINNIINYKTNNARISDFKGKLLILDFWTTWCSPCIAMFSKTDSLEKAFKDEVLFLPVTYEKKQDAAFLLSKMNKVNNIMTPSVVEDTILSKYFHHATVPHYVWIDNNSRVIAITNMTEVNTENIRKAIEGKAFLFNLKEDKKRELDMFKNAFTEVFSSYSNLKKDTSEFKIDTIKGNLEYFHSIFTGPMPGIQGYVSFDEYRFTAINVAPLLVLRDFYGFQEKFGRNPNTFFAPGRTVFELNDTMLLYKLNGGYLNRLNDPVLWEEWAKKYCITYECIVPHNFNESKKNAFIENDLQKYMKEVFGVSFGIEKRTINTLVLKQNGNKLKLQTSGGNRLEKFTPFSFQMKNAPFVNFLENLTNFYRDKFPIVNLVSYTGNIDISLDSKITDYKELNKQLVNYGLVLEPKAELQDVLVLKSLN
jgi:thiol-disulfide isomerase/thioredoxin